MSSDEEIPRVLFAFSLDLHSEAYGSEHSMACLYAIYPFPKILACKISTSSFSKPRAVAAQAQSMFIVHT